MNVEGNFTYSQAGGPIKKEAVRRIDSFCKPSYSIVNCTYYLDKFEARWSDEESARFCRILQLLLVNIVLNMY